MADRPTIVLGDLHLTRGAPASLAQDLVSVCASAAGGRLVFAGDLLDLSADRPRLNRARAIEEVFDALPQVRAALGQHVQFGGELCFVGGNHDAHVGTPAMRDALLNALRIAPEHRAAVRTSPWFLRFGGLHIEHGHLYDPDNTPIHPLVLGRRSLGVHFVEEFIAPTGAHAFLHANDNTPAKLFLSSFAWYGWRAPHVIYRYFHCAALAMAASGPGFDPQLELLEGKALLDRYCKEIGIDEVAAERVRELGAQPRMANFGGTFTRIYFDRVTCTLAMLLGAAAIASGRSPGWLPLLGGAAGLSASWLMGHDRYGGTTRELVDRNGPRVADATGAALVVFGHTHFEAEGDRYANTGSFAFPTQRNKRPYLRIEGTPDRPRAVRQHFDASAAR